MYQGHKERIHPLGYAGAGFVRTLNINNIAEQSVRFTNYAREIELDGYTY